VNPINPPKNLGEMADNERWQPYKNQVSIYNIVDYGYDIRNKQVHPIVPVEVLVIVFARQCGKTESIASLIANLLIRFAGAQIGVMSNTADNAEKFVGRIKFFLTNSVFASLLSTIKSDRLILSNGSAVFSFGQTENIRGNSFWWLFIDEAAQFTDIMLEGAAFPTVRAAGVQRRLGLPSIILTSTPRGQHGLFFDYYRRGLEQRKVVCRNCKHVYERREFVGIKWDRNKCDIKTPCQMCGATDYEYMDGRIAVIHPDPYDHPFKTKEQLEAELEEAGNTPMARQELLAEFIAEGEGVFRREWMDQAVDARLINTISPDPRLHYSMAVDLGKTHDATVISIGHNDESKTRRVLDYMEHHPGKGGQEYSEIRYFILKQVANWKPDYLIVDPTGIGDAVAEQIFYDLGELATKGVSGKYHYTDPYGRKQDVDYFIPPVRKLRTIMYSNKKNHYGYWFDANSKFDLIENTIHELSRGNVSIPAQYSGKAIETFWDEMLNFSFDYSQTGKVLYGTQSAHDDCVISFCLLIWVLKQRPFIKARPHLGDSDMYVLSDLQEE